jgi:hypothetical protein
MLRRLNDSHTSMRPRRGAFRSSVGQHGEFHCFFAARMARRSSASHLGIRTETSTENSGRSRRSFRDPREAKDTRWELSDLR